MLQLKGAKEPSGWKGLFSGLVKQGPCMCRAKRYVGTGFFHRPLIFYIISGQEVQGSNPAASSYLISLAQKLFYAKKDSKEQDDKYRRMERMDNWGQDSRSKTSIGDQCPPIQKSKWPMMCERTWKQKKLWFKIFLFCSWVSISCLQFTLKLIHDYAKWSIYKFIQKFLVFNKIELSNRTI